MASNADKPKVLAALPNIFTQMHEAKVKSGKSFETIAKECNRSEWYIAGIFYGQGKPEKKDIEALSKSLDIRQQYLEESLGDSFWPDRGLGEMPPRDPVIYRLYECLLVYAYPIKHMIHEKFGDGIMSAIDFYGDVERVPDPAGDRVKITLNGKFLNYRRW